MARFLALDWDHQQVTVVAAAVKGGAVRFQGAVTFPEARSPNPGEAEALGKELRERLAAAGIAPAPVLACLGRDRVIVKDVRHPAVPPHEEPALVRFQVVKELTDAPEDVVIDYAPSPGGGNGERRALALVVRRDVLDSYQKVCKAAGLKLVALTPRPFGVVGCLARVAGTTVRTPAPEPPDAAMAVVTVGAAHAEFNIVRGETLLLARSLAAGPHLAGEIRRSVAVHDGQSPQQPVRAAYVAGTGDAADLRDRLHQSLGLPVYPFDPFDGAEGAGVPDERRGDYAGAVGLLHLWAAGKELPVNFVQPKQPKPPRDPNKRRLVLAGAAAVLLVLGGIGYCVADVAARNKELAGLLDQKADLERLLARYDDDGKRIKAVEDWNAGEIVWLDELYDLTDRFPDINNIRLTQFSAQPRTKTGKDGKDRPVAKLTLNGIARDEGNFKWLNQLQNQLVQDGQDGRYRVEPKTVKRNQGVDAVRFRQQFTTSLELERVPPDHYSRQMPAPKESANARGRPPARGGRRPPGNFPNVGNFFGGDAP